MHGQEIHKASHEPHEPRYREQLSGVYCSHGATQPPLQPSSRTSHPKVVPEHSVVPSPSSGPHPAAPTSAPGNLQSASRPTRLPIPGRGCSREGAGVSTAPDPPTLSRDHSKSLPNLAFSGLPLLFLFSPSSLQDKIKGRSWKQNTTFFFTGRLYTEGLSNESVSGTSN